MVPRPPVDEGEELGLRAMVEAIPGTALFGIGGDGLIASWNAGAERLLGHRAGDIVGRPFADLFTPEDRAIDTPGDELRIARQDGSARDDRWLVRADGSRVFVNGSLSALRAADGSIVGFVKLVQAAKSPEYHHGLAEAMPQIVWTAGADGRLDYVNQVFALLLDRPVETAMGTAWTAIIHPDDIDGTLRLWTHSVETGEDYEVTHRVRVAGGAYRWFLSRAKPVKEQDGRVVKWFGTSTDIEELKHAQAAAVDAIAALEVEHRRLRAMLDSLPVGAFIADASGRIVEANAQVGAIWGGSPKVASIAEYSCYHGWWADSGRSLACEDWALARALLHGETSIGEVIDIERFDGKRGTILNNAAPIRDADGALIGGVAVIVDLTERRRMEQELRRANEELDQFAAIASHDLQEPLRMIRSYLTLFLRQAGAHLSESERGYLAEASDGADRMMRLIRHLLEYSRVHHGALHLERTSSTGALVEAIHNLQQRIVESGGKVTHGRLPHVVADRSHLIRLFQNLVGNGLKYHRPGIPPEVHVEAAARGEEWEFSVADHGIGIPAGERERIFELFARLHSRVEFHGTGLGLAICMRIVARHGGRIWVDSTVGGGSTFRFTLPGAERETG